MDIITTPPTTQAFLQNVETYQDNEYTLEVRKQCGRPIEGWRFIWYKHVTNYHRLFTTTLNEAVFVQELQQLITC